MLGSAKTPSDEWRTGRQPWINEGASLQRRAVHKVRARGRRASVVGLRIPSRRDEGACLCGDATRGQEAAPSGTAIETAHRDTAACQRRRQLKHGAADNVELLAVAAGLHIC